MLLFFISFLMVFISSYLIASLFESKKYLTGIIYTLLIAFAQIVFTIELLSLFTAISKVGVLAINAVILAVVLFIWGKQDKPLYRPQFKLFISNIWKAVKKDKMLAVILLGWLCFVFVSLFLCFVTPVMAYDSLAYHVNRALVWASQGSLAHFDIADFRNINMAINSEILYTWLFTFNPRNMFIGFFSFAGYTLAASALYSILEIIGYSMRKRLWAVFLMTSLAGVVVEASGAETDVLVGGLILAGVGQFLLGVKKNSLVPIYFSSLAISVVVGTKTSAFFMLPAVALLFVYFLLRYQKSKFWYYTGIFLGFSLLNFLIFSSYNYILNYLDFGNFIANEQSREYHSMQGGLKGFVSCFIRHLVLLLDFTGFTYGFFIQKYIFNAQDFILTMLNIPLDLNVISSNDNMLNFMINDSLIGGGVVGTFVFLPCAIVAILKGLFCGKCDKNKLLALLGFSLFLSIFVMSLCIGFMLFSSRFLVSFFVLASPVLVLSYIRSNKNIFKYIILFWVMSYLVLVSSHLWQRQFMRITKHLLNGISVREIRTKNLCTLNWNYEGKMPYCDLRSYLYRFHKGSTIGVFSSISSSVAVLKFMEADGYKIDFLLTEKINEYDLSKYDLLVFCNYVQDSHYIQRAKEIVENYEIKNGQVHLLDKNKPNCFLMKSEVDVITKENLGKDVTSFARCFVPVEILSEQGFKPIMQIIYGNFGSDTSKKVEDGSFLIFKR